MILKYVGRHSPIALMVKNKDGGMGITVKTGDSFECSPMEGANILARFNENGRKPLFVEGDQGKSAGKKNLSDKNKMMKEMLKK